MHLHSHIRFRHLIVDNWNQTLFRTDPTISTIRYWPSKWVALSQICLSRSNVLALIPPHLPNYLSTHWATHLPTFNFTVIIWHISLVWLTTEWRHSSLVRFIFNAPNKGSKSIMAPPNCPSRNISMAFILRPFSASAPASDGLWVLSFSAYYKNSTFKYQFVCLYWLWRTIRYLVLILNNWSLYP